MTLEEMEWSDIGRSHGPLVIIVNLLLLFACIGVEVVVGSIALTVFHVVFGV